MVRLHENAASPPSRWPVKPRFGQIDIALDSAQRLIVDRFFVAQRDDGVALGLQHVAR